MSRPSPRRLLFLVDVRMERRQINKGADWHCLAWRWGERLSAQCPRHRPRQRPELNALWVLTKV